MAMNIIFPMQYFLYLSSRPRSLNVSKKVSHPFEKTPKELIDKFTNFTDLLWFFYNEIYISFSFPVNICTEVEFTEYN